MWLSRKKTMQFGTDCLVRRHIPQQMQEYRLALGQLAKSEQKSVSLCFQPHIKNISPRLRLHLFKSHQPVVHTHSVCTVLFAMYHRQT